MREGSFAVFGKNGARLLDPDGEHRYMCNEGAFCSEFGWYHESFVPFFMGRKTFLFVQDKQIECFFRKKHISNAFAAGNKHISNELQRNSYIFRKEKISEDLYHSFIRSAGSIRRRLIASITTAKDNQ